MKRLIISCILLGFAVIELNAQKLDIPKLTGPYLGQEPPGMIPVMFAKGIISTERNELNCSFRKDGREMFFTRTLDDRHTLMTMKLAGQRWTNPEIAAFSGKYTDVDPFISATGQRLYFSSKRPFSGTGEKDSDLWYCEKNSDGKWGVPIRIPGINTPERHDYYTSVTNEGDLYLSIFSEDGRIGNLYIVKNGSRNPKKLPSPLNTPYNEHDPFIFPTGNTLIFSSSRPGGFGQNDLYICFRSSDGSWSQPENMGPAINTAGYDYCPIISHDGRYFFFTRSRNGNGDIYWVDAKIINKFTREN